MNKNATATSLLLLGTFFWGATFVFVKEGIAIIDVYTFLGWRFSIASSLLLLIFFKKFKEIDVKTIKYGIGLGIVLMASYTAQTVGLLYTTASKAAFITGLSVVFVPIMLSIEKKKIPGINNIAAVLIATAGLALLTISGSLNFNRGDAWILLCAILFAFYIILVGRYARIFESIKFTIVQLTTVALISTLIAIMRHQLIIPKDGEVWRALLICAVFATSYMYVIQNQFQKFISEVKAAIIFSFEPLFAAIVSYFYLNERLTPRILVGGFLIFLGMIVSEIKINKSIPVKFFS